MKNKALYIYADTKGAGSLVVTLGIFTSLKRKIKNVAFFRPIVQEREDYDLRFIQEYFMLAPARVMRGFTLQEARHIIATQSAEVLFERLIERFDLLCQENDFVVCEGIYSDLFANIVDLDINLEIAKNFAAPLICVINAYKKTKDEIFDAYLLQKEAAQKARLRVLATILNRVDEDLVTVFRSAEDSLYAVAEKKELSQTSLADIVAELSPRLLKFSDTDYARKVEHVKVAAMGLENFLGKIETNDLVVVPGDRGEIVLGLLCSFYSKRSPNISGIVFSNDQTPHANIYELIEGLERFSLPMLVVPEDTYTTATKIAQIRPKIRINDTYKISLSLGVFEKYVDVAAIEEKLRLYASDVVTPQMFEYKLFRLAKRQRKKIVLPEAHDVRVLQAAEIILNRDVADIVFLAKPKDFKQYYEQLGFDLSKAEAIDYTASNFISLFGNELYKLRKHKGLTKEQALDAVTHVNYFATMMVHLGYADAMVSGATHSTAETIRPALQIIKTKSDADVVSSIFFMCLETRVLVFGDCAVLQNPTDSQLADVAIQAAMNAIRFGIEPKIAMISYASGESASGEDVEKVKRATRIVKERRPDLLVEGPIQFDAAFDKEVARKKMPHSKVAGEASVFIFPDLNTGNTTYKAVQRSSDAIAIGPILQGLKKPINDLSRGCLVKDIVNTIAITAVLAQEGV